MRHYVLDEDGNPVRETDLVKWAMRFSELDRTMRFTVVGVKGINRSEISTVFLGLDHSMSNVGPPLLYETMVFGGPLSGVQRRYSTRQEAQDGHEEIRKAVHAKINTVKNTE